MIYPTWFFKIQVQINRGWYSVTVFGKYYFFQNIFSGKLHDFFAKEWGKVYNNFSRIFDSGGISTSKGKNYFFNKLLTSCCWTQKKLCTAIKEFRKGNLLNTSSIHSVWNKAGKKKRLTAVTLALKKRPFIFLRWIIFA